jgi:N-carbamoylputrescine amidase
MALLRLAAVPGLTCGAAPGGRETLRIASLMYQPVKWDKQANQRGLEKAIREAKRQGAELVVTPEGALEGYVVNEVIRASGGTRRELTARFNDLAEPCDGPYIRHFQTLCRELGVWLVLGFLEADDPNTYNTAALIRPDGTLAGKYRKTHFAQGYSSGDQKGDNPPGYSRGSAYPVFDVNRSKMGIMICYDRREPTVAQRLVENHADFIVNPSYGMRGDCNREFISARARENGVPVVFVHPEQTVVSDAQGRITADLRPKEGDARIALVRLSVRTRD